MSVSVYQSPVSHQTPASQLRESVQVINLSLLATRRAGCRDDSPANRRRSQTSPSIFHIFLFVVPDPWRAEAAAHMKSSGLDLLETEVLSDPLSLASCFSFV